MVATLKKLTTVILSCLLIGMLSLSPAMAQPQAKNMKKAKAADTFQGQQFFLAGVGDLAVELRLVNGKLASLYFWNNSDQEVSVEIAEEKFIVPSKGYHQEMVKPLNQFLVTVKAYDPTIDESTDHFFPGQQFLFVKAKDRVGYDMYTTYSPNDAKESKTTATNKTKS